MKRIYLATWQLYPAIPPGLQSGVLATFSATQEGTRIIQGGFAPLAPRDAPLKQVGEEEASPCPGKEALSGLGELSQILRFNREICLDKRVKICYNFNRL